MNEFARVVSLGGTSSGGSTTTAIGFPARQVRVYCDSTQNTYINIGTTSITATSSAGFQLLAVATNVEHDKLEIYADRIVGPAALPLAVAGYVAGSATTDASNGTIRIYATDV